MAIDNIANAKNQAIFFRYISEKIPAGILDNPLATFEAEKIAPYATSERFNETFKNGPITDNAL